MKEGNHQIRLGTLVLIIMAALGLGVASVCLFWENIVSSANKIVDSIALYIIRGLFGNWI